MTKVMGLFPSPFMKVDGFLDATMLSKLDARVRDQQRASNSATDLLSHTDTVDPSEDPLFSELRELVAPHLVRFGQLLFAKELNWYVTGMWMNVLERGGKQFMHTHANSFISAIIYVTTPHESARTVFRKSSGGTEFIFKNDVPMGHFSSDTWILPDAKAGDLALYPSYLMHGVPPNEGEQRITVAMNAVPDELDSLGYKIRFEP